MNKYFERELEMGKSNPLLPLKASGNITLGNATRIDWEEVCPKVIEEEIYLMGNPPYLGSFLQTKDQKKDLAFVCKGFKSYKDLDYISCWFIKSAVYSQDHKVKFPYVTTNSICQGEQVSLLWPFILSQGLEIFFAYQAFKWTNNAKGNAGVYCTIIGIQENSKSKKKLFNESTVEIVENINPYLTSGSSVVLKKRTKPLSSIPPMNYGIKIVDKGNLIFSTEEKNGLEKDHPESKKLFKRLLGSAEFIRGKERWCLYIPDNLLELAKSIPQIQERLNKVSDFRKKSTESSTREMASEPQRFYYSVHKDTNSIIVSRTSSQRREYIPMGFLDGETIVSDAASVIFDATIWNFGIVTSKMHMVWVQAVGGRLKQDYRYSSQLCYNTFPFPEIDKKIKSVLICTFFQYLKNVRIILKRH